VNSIKPYLMLRCQVSAEQVSKFTLQVQEQHSLVYAGPLAGRRPGIISTDKGLVLVTTSFRLTDPKPGKWRFIQRMLEGRLGRQAQHLYVYLKLGYEALRDGKMTPGLFLAFVGPPNMHKTCVQELIITPILGGRTAEPWQFFTSATEFNGDFLGAEHLIITDVDVKGNVKNTHIGSKVKQYCGTSDHRIHAKGRDAFQAEVFWRITQSCNDSWPHILALPDLADDTVRDKVLLLHFDGEEFGDWMPSERSQIQAKIARELPCFINHLVKMKIPPQALDKRFGQRAYQNRIAQEKYFNVTHEADLLEIIDEMLFSKGGLWRPAQPGDGWEGRAKELESLLQMDRDCWQRCQRLGAIGQQLGKLLSGIAKNPATRQRVRVTTRANRSYYYIYPPPPPPNPHR